MNIIVMIPTYNESENIEKLVAAIYGIKIPKLSVLVVDDNSPDMTWQKVESMQKVYPTLQLLRRLADKGRGLAGIAGFQYCLEHNADVVVEMDADFSHDPRYIPDLIKGLESADVVLGSRRVPGGKDVGRSWWRVLITYFANKYIRLMTGIKVHDCNSGFRAFKAEVLKAVKLEEFMSVGPSIVQEMLFKAHMNGFKIKEIPIIFVDRTVGKSKLTWREMYQGYKFIWRLKWLQWTKKI